MHRKKYMEGENVREYRKKNHLCYYCGNPIDLPSGKLCGSCMERCRENGKKGSGNNDYWKQDNRIVFMKARNKA